MTYKSLTINDSIAFKHRGTDSDFGVIRQVFENQDYRIDELSRYGPIRKCAMEILARNKKTLVIDCGANIGASAIYFDMLFGGSTIIAVEPDIQNYELLELNSRAFPNIQSVHAAVSSQDGAYLNLVDPGMGEWGFRTEAISNVEDSSGQTVPTVSVESFMDIPDTCPMVLKIDIEGAEDDLFSANTSRFHEFPLIIIELHDWMLPRKGNSHNFLKWHAEQDRDFVLCGENIFSISNTLVS